MDNPIIGSDSPPPKKEEKIGLLSSQQGAGTYGVIGGTDNPSDSSTSSGEGTFSRVAGMDDDLDVTTSMRNVGIQQKTPLIDLEAKHGDLSMEADEKKGGMLGAIFNLSNGLIGAGTLSFPYTAFCAGMVFEGVLGVFVIVLTVITLNILMWAAMQREGNIKGFRSYQEAVEYYLGSFWKKACEIVILFYTTFLLCTYFVVISEFIKPLIDFYFGDKAGLFKEPKMIISTFAILIIFPLTLARSIRKLGFTSFVAIAGLAYFTIFIVVNAIVQLSSRGLGPGISWKNIIIQTDPYPGTKYPLLFMTIPIITFAYQSHAIIFPISFEIRKRDFTFGKLNIVILISIAIVTTIYFSNAFLGFLTFGNEVEDNVLNNFEGGNVFANISRFFIGLSITFSFPLMNYASRLTLRTLLFPKREKLPTLTFLITQVLYFIIVLVLALFVPAISVGFGLIGSFASSSLMFLFPALLLLKLAKDLPLGRKIACYVFSAFLIFLVIAICSTGCIASILRIIQATS